MEYYFDIYNRKIISDWRTAAYTISDLECNARLHPNGKWLYWRNVLLAYIILKGKK